MIGNERKKDDATLIAALAGGATVRAAAKLAGIGEATAHRRLRGANFRAQVAAARTEALTRAMGKLADATTEAADTLRTLLSDGHAESVRLRAAVEVIDLAAKLRDQLDIAERIAEIERRLGAQGIA